jgi:YrbI family 3-deoxy-D-manno-octulosonate 8-phosphate phosphatase
MDLNKYIKLAVFDFDGVFSDKIYISNDGIITKSVNPKDTYSLKILQDNKIKIGIITACDSNVINNINKITSRIDFLSTGNYDKLSVIKTWTDKLNINFKNVSYIGDDIFDVPVIKSVGFSGCPADAVNECLKTVNFVCKNKGGNGAVREFVNEIISINSINRANQIQNEDYDLSHIKENGKITAVIPVRSGSIRCKNKNIRDFGDTNLLKRKIEILKQLSEIDEIIVSSNCDKMLKIGSDLGVVTHKRDEKYCSSECSGRDLYIGIAKNIKNEIILYTPCVTPFVTVDYYKKSINEWKNKNNSNDSINTVNVFQNFLWYDNKPINYDCSNTPQSQLLPIYYTPNFGINIIKTIDVFKYKNIIGKNPKFIETPSINGIDIDYPPEFVISELLYNHNIECDEDATNLLKRRDCYENVEMLDCTIRDGGYLNNWEFTDDEVLECYKSVSNAGYKYFEIGFKSSELLSKEKGKWYYSKEKDIQNIKSKCLNGCKIAVLAKINNFLESDFPEKKLSNIDLIRVLIERSNVLLDDGNIFYSEEDVQNAVVIINNLIKKGYEVTFNVGCADIISDNEIDFICKYICDIKLKALYLADTYGSFNEKNIPIVLNKFQKKLNKYNPSNTIVFGFHIHNNNEDALIKYKYAKYFGFGMIDSCICGLGRGAGNLQTEQVMLNKYNTNIDRKILWDVLSIGSKLCKYNDFLNEKGYFNKFFYAISGLFSLHPDYIKELMEDNTLTYKKKYDIIFKLNDYVKENKEFNFNKLLIKSLV